jgi:hypothetical protein
MTRTVQNAVFVVALPSSTLSVTLHAKAANNRGSSQQDQAKACNDMADSKSLKGDDGKNFMQECLKKAGNQQLNDMSQKDKATVCNDLADKKNVTGIDRRCS